MEYRIRWYTEENGEQVADFHYYDIAREAFNDIVAHEHPVTVTLDGPGGVLLDYHDSL